MLSAKHTRMVVALILIASASGMTYYLVEYGASYAAGAQALGNARQSVHLEMVRTTARDGTPLKAILMADPANWSRTDHSVPFVVVCHGMSGDFYNMLDEQYTLAKMGYVTLSIEFRGHTSNPAPTTLGTEEPADLLAFVDWLEANATCVDINKGAAYGHSMGALYATLAYIFESAGRGRFKALVSLSPPANVSREIEFLTNSPGALGEIPFTSNLTGPHSKNPVDLITNHSIRNVLLAHGTVDTTVDYQATIDFVNVLDPLELTDPANSWPDVKFITAPGSPHVLGLNLMMDESFAWIDQKVLGKTTQPSDVKRHFLSFSPSRTRRDQASLLYASILLVFVLASVVYLARPQAYKTRLVEPKEPVPDSNSSTSPSPAVTPWSGPAWLEKQRGVKLGAMFFALQFASGVVAYLIPGYIVNELAYSAVASVIFLAIIMRWTRPKGVGCLIDSVNPNAALVWILCTVGGLSLYFLIPAIPALEDATLAVGPRITWWIPFLTAVLTTHLVTLTLLARITLPPTMGKMRKRLAEMITCGALFGGGVLVFLFWNWGTILRMPFLGGLTLPIIPAISAIFAMAFIAVNLVAQVLEVPSKSVVSGALACALATAIFVGASYLIFFY